MNSLTASSVSWNPLDRTTNATGTSPASSFFCLFFAEMIVTCIHSSKPHTEYLCTDDL